MSISLVKDYKAINFLYSTIHLTAVGMSIIISNAKAFIALSGITKLMKLLTIELRSKERMFGDLLLIVKN